MVFVVDASMAAAWVVADERTPAADVLLGRVKTETGRIPDLFWHETRNLLVKIERRGRSPLARVCQAYVEAGLQRKPVNSLALLDLAYVSSSLTYASAEVALSALRQLPVTVVANWSDAEILDLARRHDVTPCDAAYLDVAIRCALPLATLDRALAGAARACGVPLLGPLAP